MQKFVNNFSSAVAQTFGAGDIYLTLTAGDGSRLPTLDVDDFILLTLFRLSGVEESGHEVVKVTAVNTDQCTVVRAFEGAAASQFLIGDKIQARATAATLAAFEPKSASIQTHISSTSNPHGVTATQVGLSNVDNTSDANKPVSTAQQTALNLKANLASPTFTGTVGGITAAMVGAESALGNPASNGMVLKSTTDGVRSWEAVSVIWVEKTANYTAGIGDAILANTAGGAWTLTLPPSPTTGSSVIVIDSAGACGTYALTIGRNNLKIMGLAENMTVNTSNAAFTLVYQGATYGWRLF